MKFSALIRNMRIGQFANGNYTEFEQSTGFIRRNGSAIYFKDMYPQIYNDPVGAAAPDIVNHTIGGVVTPLLCFDGLATEERRVFKFEIDHDLLITLSILNALNIRPNFHVHWCPTTTATGAVEWFVDWCHIPVHGAPSAMTTLNKVHTIASNSQYYNLLTEIGEFPNTLSFGIGDIIIAALRRTPNGAADTYGADAGLFQFALHAACDTDGSRTMYTK